MRGPQLIPNHVDGFRNHHWNQQITSRFLVQESQKLHKFSKLLITWYKFPYLVNMNQFWNLGIKPRFQIMSTKIHSCRPLKQGKAIQPIDIRVDSLDAPATSLNWQVHYMYRIQQGINKPVLITRKVERNCVLSFDGYGCMYTQRQPRAGSKKHTCPLPLGINLVLSCTVASA